jgi:hypothetical protein
MGLDDWILLIICTTLFTLWVCTSLYIIINYL